MTTITIPKEYGYVVATAIAACLYSTVQGIQVTTLRKPADVPYPNAYASAESIAAATPEMKQKKYIFNCTQRSHANYLENLPILLTTILVSGAKYPLIATGLGVGWITSKLFYSIGYRRADKTEGKGRTMGSAFWLFQFSLVGLLGKTAFDLIAQ